MLSAFFLLSGASPAFAEDISERADDVAATASVQESESANTVKAENVDLKAVVEEPLVPIQPTEQSSQQPSQKPIPQTETPVETADLKEDVDQGGVDVESEQAPINAEKDPDLVEEEPESPAAQEAFILLNTEVAPGTSTRMGWSPGATFIGIAAPTAVLAINGANPGPTLCLTAAVHGDELNGIEIVRRVLYDIDPEKLSGEIIGVPIVNLQGFRRGSRYLPDRRDLNRFFPGNPDGSSASRIAYSFFSQVVTKCDMLIDLHTGSFRRTNLPQLRADLNYPEVAQLAEKMGAIVVVQSEGAPGSLRRATTEVGIPAVTLEAGAPHELDKSAIEHGVKSIESALDSLGMIKRRRFWEREAEPIYYESTWVRAKEGGILFSEVVLGASVSEGDLLGTVTDPITNRRTEIRAPFAGQIIGMALNQVMFPGFAAYHLGHMPAPGNESAHVPAMVEGASSSMEGGSHGAETMGDHSMDEAEPDTGDVDLVPIEDSE